VRATGTRGFWMMDEEAHPIQLDRSELPAGHARWT